MDEWREREGWIAPNEYVKFHKDFAIADLNERRNWRVLQFHEGKTDIGGMEVVCVDVAILEYSELCIEPKWVIKNLEWHESGAWFQDGVRRYEAVYNPDNKYPDSALDNFAARQILMNYELDKALDTYDRENVMGAISDGIKFGMGQKPYIKIEALV